MEFLGWNVIFETDKVFGYKSKRNGAIWFVKSDKKSMQDYDERGVNHISIRVMKQSDINSLVEFIKDRNIKTLFGTPKHRVEFVDNKSETYYQVMFESPDKILFEVVYIGLKDIAS